MENSYISGALKEGIDFQGIISNKEAQIQKLSALMLIKCSRSKMNIKSFIGQ
ncbi:MAG: hypothetical protein Q8942_05620 [Bacillota bacterium]|nr:hypothetical protein [Bacillota bacterium]